MARPKKLTNQNKLPFYNKYNRHLHVSDGQTFTLPSQAVQGEGISMAEMIRRYTRGDIPPLAMEAFMGNDPDINKPVKHLQDLTQIDDLRAELEVTAIAGNLRSKSQDPREAEGKITKAEEASAESVEERSTEGQNSEA